MKPDQVDLMVTMAKELTEQGKILKGLMNQILDNRERSSKPILSTDFDIPQPARTSVVDHEGTLNRFKMELKFEGGEQMAEQQRQDHAIHLLTEIEDLLSEYGVTRLTGTYERTAKPVQA